MLLDYCFAILLKRMLMLLAETKLPFAFVLLLFYHLLVLLFCFEIFLVHLFLQESEIQLVGTCVRRFPVVSGFQALILCKLFVSVFFPEPANYEYSFYRNLM